MLLSQMIKSAGLKIPAAPAKKHILLTGLGAGLAVSFMAMLHHLSSPSIALLVGSFGASSVMIFGYPEAPFAQPRNVIGGHLIAASSAVLFMQIFGVHGWVLGLSMGVAIALMMWLRVAHPPAGSNPVIIFLSAIQLGTPLGWQFVFFPVLSGVLVLVALGVVYNRWIRDLSYPQYW
ncbi:MAG: HPP family protein [Methylophilaceae bacterium]|nr:HPP family protein [Methylophilaceae bacterium]